MEKKETTRLILRVPNDPDGQSFMKKFRKYLNRDTYKMRLHGNNPDRKGLSEKTGISHLSLQQDVPLKHSTELRVYLDRKDGKVPISWDEVYGVSNENRGLKNQIEELQNESDDLRDQLSDKDDEIKNLHVKLSDKMEELHDCRGQLQSYEQNIGDAIPSIPEGHEIEEEALRETTEDAFNRFVDCVSGQFAWLNTHIDLDVLENECGELMETMKKFILKWNAWNYINREERKKIEKEEQESRLSEDKIKSILENIENILRGN